ncbi:MAG: hypothetical protein QXP01_03730 [Candidatus Hadarchaeum sp.]
MQMIPYPKKAADEIVLGMTMPNGQVAIGGQKEASQESLITEYCDYLAMKLIEALDRKDAASVSKVLQSIFQALEMKSED